MYHSIPNFSILEDCVFDKFIYLLISSHIRKLGKNNITKLNKYIYIY